MKTYNFRRKAGSSQQPSTVFSLAIILLSLALLAGCSSTGRVVVDSANQNSRVRVVVIHFTVADFQESLDLLTLPSDRPVSSHYLVPEPDDPSYQKNRLKLYVLVAEEQRAWHAGTSYWAGKIALNDMSIGIENVNRAYCHSAEESPIVELPAEDLEEEPASICFFPDFPNAQMDMLIELLEGIMERHPDVLPINIIGHSDIAPQRKIDPGPRFPWQRLYRMGFGAWYDNDTVVRYWEQFSTQIPPTLKLQEALHAYGYEIDLTGEADTQNHNVVRAFQMHFIPWRVTGTFDRESAAVLFALIEKYRESDLEQLLQIDSE